jgi:hypothetical protein
MRWLIAAWFATLVFSSPASAQVQRLLPANGKLGELYGGQQYPLVGIDSNVLRLAPGGVILDQSNRYIVHAYLPARADVLYVLDHRGEISRIVILTPEELARLKQAGAR